jgi:glutamyl-tRNA reductase
VDAVLQSLAKGLSAKLMHGALTELRSADDNHRDQISDAVARLFLRANLHRQDPRSMLTH